MQLNVGGDCTLILKAVLLVRTAELSCDGRGIQPRKPDSG